MQDLLFYPGIVSAWQLDLACMVETMKLLATFYSRGDTLAPGWWARVEESKGRRVLRHLWDDTAGPDFDDLAAVIADLSPDRGLDGALRAAREDHELVRRTKPVTQEPLGPDSEW